MKDRKGISTEDVGSGSALLHVDTTPLSSGESRESAAVRTIYASTLGIDISADQDCTVKIVRLPDGETDGAESDVGIITAGTPGFMLYTSLLCPAIKVVVENTGGADMTAFAMYVRGAA